MSDRPRIGLDNPAFRGRVRQPIRAGVASMSASNEIRRPFGPRVALRSLAPPALASAQPTLPAAALVLPGRRPAMTDIAVTPQKITAIQPAPARVVTSSIAEVVFLPVSVPTVQVVAPQTYAMPAHPKLQKSQVLRRPNIATAIAKPEQPAKAKRNKLQYAVVAMAGFVFLTGMIVSLLTLQTNHSAKTQVAALAQKSEQSDGTTVAGAPPAEAPPPPTAVKTYQVAPDLPKYIEIPKLNVKARVKSLSVNAKNELQAPNSIYDAGWYNGSAKPGDGPGSGAAVIDGHVHGPTQPGIFVNLKKLVAGDIITITRGDNKVISYKVVKTQNYEAANLDIGNALTSAIPGQSALNLITCGGPYDKASGEYTQRTIVFAIAS